MREQTARRSGRILGPSEPVAWTEGQRAVVAAHAARLRQMLDAPAPAPMAGLHSLPNSVMGGAVRQVAKDKVVRLFPGVEIGAQAMTRDQPMGGLLDSQDPLRGHGTDSLAPVMELLAGNTQLLSELSGVHDIEDFRQDELPGGGLVLHSPYVPQKGTQVNGKHLGMWNASRDDVPMAELPQLEHFATFRDWIEASRRTRGFTKVEMAKAVGIARQTYNKWSNHGGKPDVEAMERIAIWADIEYVALRLLVDGRPQLGSHKARVDAAKSRNPKVAYIASRLDQLADDEQFMATLEDMVDAQLRRRAQARQKKQAS